MRVVGFGDRGMAVVEAAYDAQLTPPYTADGKMERLEDQLERTRNMLAKVVNVLCAAKLVDAEQLKALLGYGYKVEED